MNLRNALPLFALALFAALPVQAAMPAKPALKVTTLDGKPYDLAAQRGRWVIVNYWATWCGPCVEEMPAISAFVAAHKDKVAAIGLAFDEAPPAEIKAFLAKHPVVYPVARVPMESPPKDFDPPMGLPTTYLIGPDGSVAKKLTGPVDAKSLAGAMNLK